MKHKCAESSQIPSLIHTGQWISPYLSPLLYSQRTRQLIESIRKIQYLVLLNNSPLRFTPPQAAVCYLNCNQNCSESWRTFVHPSPEVSRAAILQGQFHSQHKPPEPRASCLEERQYLPLLPPEKPKGEDCGMTQLLNCKCQISIFTSGPATIR